MRNHYNDDKIKFYIGDVRDYTSIESYTDAIKFHLNMK